MKGCGNRSTRIRISLISLENLKFKQFGLHWKCWIGGYYGWGPSKQIAFTRMVDNLSTVYKRSFILEKLNGYAATEEGP